VFSASGMVRDNTSQTSVAIKAPTPNPDCKKPAPFGRAWFGHVSATSATPLLHSLPMARPVTKRSAANSQKPVANAVKPVNSA